ncbi:hypothetical protein F5883DRAFT_654259 [Diaporthe sp. PMI_573]|nr:hypothetical protein F5883DRAFT_654259 [Diaporthaceae sp. PMI_573]
MRTSNTRTPINLCGSNIRIELIEARDDLPQSRGFGHLMHCLDGIRQDIMPDADDNLRWTGPGAKLVAGNGQMRMCRNFTKLEEWAKQYSACYSYKGDDVDEFPIIDHYKHCPAGNPLA